jgi:perosamine synthetase
VTLHAILAALGIGPGDEVIVPTLTYISTANVVLFQGAELKLCECDPANYNVRVEDLEKVVSPRTRAVITVDMNGLPIDYRPIVAWAKSRNITIVADSAESLGAVYRGKAVGTQAPVHSFSFFGNKNVTTGEGGMITTDDDALAAELRILRNQGQQGRYNHTHLGFNYRMTELSAAIGIIQLQSLEARLAAKERTVARYNQAFAREPLMSLPVVPDYVERHSWYMYAPCFAASVDRDAVVAKLEAANIETRVSFPPVHIQPYYVKRYGFQVGDFPVSHGAWRRLINLPIGPDLTTAQLDTVIAATLDAARGSVRG